MNLVVSQIAFSTDKMLHFLKQIPVITIQILEDGVIKNDSVVLSQQRISERAAIGYSYFYCTYISMNNIRVIVHVFV